MLAVTPPRNHWWHVTLYVDPRGLRGTTFEVRFDFVDHALVVATAGRSGSFELRDGLAVSEFDDRLHRTLADLGLDVESAYEAGSRLAGWDTAALESAWCPAPSELEELQAGAAAAFGR